MNMKTSRLPLTVLALLLAGFGTLAAATAGNEQAWRQLLEKEWLLEAQLHAESAHAARPTTRDDAAGGCDGVTNGKWGFHTAEQENPWWQVDLGEVLPMAQVRIWNRSDTEGAAKRAARFEVLLSDDAKGWRRAYQHDGTVFYGYHMPDRSPLVVKLTNAAARLVRIQLPGKTFLHLDEVEVIRAGRWENVALNKPAEQSSVSQWSMAHRVAQKVDWRQATAKVVERHPNVAAFAGLKSDLASLPPDASAQSLYLRARALQRQLVLASPLLDFDAILFTKRVPGSFNHMSDQYYGWWSRPGGGICILRGFKSGVPTVECLTEASFKEPGSFLRPALSFDAKKILFAWCKHYPQLAKEQDKLNKANVPEDAFYHVFEMSLDGSGVRQLTHGKYDNFDARYLPEAASCSSPRAAGRPSRLAKPAPPPLWRRRICRTATCAAAVARKGRWRFTRCTR